VLSEWPSLVHASHLGLSDALELTLSAGIHLERGEDAPHQSRVNRQPFSGDRFTSRRRYSA
jgi:hypothetical protein